MHTKYTNLAFLWVTLVLRGQMTARNLSQEMAERVSTLETMQRTTRKRKMFQSSPRDDTCVEHSYLTKHGREEELLLEV